MRNMTAKTDTSAEELSGCRAPPLPDLDRPRITAAICRTLRGRSPVVEDEQRALDQALAALLPPRLRIRASGGPPSRRVEGRSLKECVARYKELRALLSQRGPAPAAAAPPYPAPPPPPPRLRPAPAPAPAPKGGRRSSRPEREPAWRSSAITPRAPKRRGRGRLGGRGRGARARRRGAARRRPRVGSRPSARARRRRRRPPRDRYRRRSPLPCRTEAKTRRGFPRARRSKAKAAPAAGQGGRRQQIGRKQGRRAKGSNRRLQTSCRAAPVGRGANAPRRRAGGSTTPRSISPSVRRRRFLGPAPAAAVALPPHAKPQRRRRRHPQPPGEQSTGRGASEQGPRHCAAEQKTGARGGRRKPSGTARPG